MGTIKQSRARTTIRRSAFGSRLLLAREKAGLTQEQVAQKLEMSQGTLSELERQGDGSLRVVQFAMLYGCDPVWLATGEGEPFQSNTRFSPQARALAQAFDAMPERTPSESEAKVRLYWGFLQMMGAMPQAN